jgi:hypothetical protein
VEHSLGSRRWAIDRFEEAGELDQDRVGVWFARDRIIVAVVDGAGGTANGALAADAAIASIGLALPDTRSRAAAALDAVDTQLLTIGQAAAVVLALDARGNVEGASAGDCGVLARCSGAWFELTENQARKPLLGSGARPLPFAFRGADLVLAATDGLFKYTQQAKIEGALIDGSPLSDLVRLRSGALPDDLAAVVLRAT